MCIGQLLAHSPINEIDCSWPKDEIRIPIDELKSDDIERGVITERFNMRGVYSKSFYDGG